MRLIIIQRTMELSLMYLKSKTDLLIILTEYKLLDSKKSQGIEDYFSLESNNFFPFDDNLVQNILFSRHDLISACIKTQMCDIFNYNKC